jgi:hypothetical protein
MKATAWRFARVALATAAGYGLQALVGKPYAWIAVPAISAIGKALREKYPYQWDWLPL